MFAKRYAMPMSLQGLNGATKLCASYWLESIKLLSPIIITITTITIPTKQNHNFLLISFSGYDIKLKVMRAISPLLPRYQLYFLCELLPCKKAGGINIFNASLFLCQPNNQCCDSGLGCIA